MSILAACGHAFVAWLHTLHDFPKKEIVSILFKRGALGRDGPSTVSLDYQMSRDNEVSKDVPWYIEGLGARLKPSVRAFYEAYTGLEGEALENHLHEIVHPSSATTILEPLTTLTESSAMKPGT